MSSHLPDQPLDGTDAFADLANFTDRDNVDEFVSFIARDGETISDVLARHMNSAVGDIAALGDVAGGEPA